MQVAESWILYAEGNYEETVRRMRAVVERRPDTEGAYYLLGRALFAAGQYQELIAIADAAIGAAGDDYNIYIPIMNALGALGKKEALKNLTQQRVVMVEKHIRNVPEDARGRCLLALDYVAVGRSEDAAREASLAMALRANDATVLYNLACVFCQLQRKDDALQAIRRAYDNGFKDAGWARRDPDLSLLHGDPEFERMFPESAA